MLYCSVFWSIIVVSVISLVASSVFNPHCFSLRYLAASCALFLCCMCSPSAFLLWNGVGLYFLLSSLIPIHLSLMSKSFETDSMILCFLSSLLLFVNCVLNIRKSFIFLSFAACFLFSSISFDLFDSSYLLFLSFGVLFGKVTRPCVSHSFVLLYMSSFSFCYVGMVFQSSFPGMVFCCM